MNDKLLAILNAVDSQKMKPEDAVREIKKEILESMHTFDDSLFFMIMYGNNLLNHMFPEDK